jgi:glucose 1-dehydrogenase
MKLQGRRALVTGSDSGIGQAIAIAFAREGADVAVHYHNDHIGARLTAEAVARYDREVVVVQWDLAKPEKARGLFDHAARALGGLDILVNCAGVFPNVEVSAETPLTEFRRVLDVDLVSPWVLCQAAVEHFARGEGGGGVIINITSVHEEIPSDGGVSYDAAKAALRSVTRTLSREVAGKGIRVNNIAPGFIATPMNAETLADPEAMKKSRENIPLGRPGKPDEVARVAVFLASDDASYVTGSSYFVDGGLMQTVGAGA